MSYDYGTDELDTGTVNKDEGLALLSEYVNLLAKQKVIVAKADDDLKAAKKRAEEIAQVLIPDLMEELGQIKCQTTTGVTVSVQPKVRARLTDETRAEAAAWLEANNFGKLLKNEFSMKLKKGQNDEAEKIRETLIALGVPFDNKLNVAPQTLGKFVKDLDAEGTAVPDNLFNVYRYREAKVTQ